MYLERSLAQSMLTMPKCSGPTRCTRSVTSPGGFCTRKRLWRERLEERVVVAIEDLPRKGLIKYPISPEGSAATRHEWIFLPANLHTTIFAQHFSPENAAVMHTK